MKTPPDPTKGATEAVQSDEQWNSKGLTYRMCGLNFHGFRGPGAFANIIIHEYILRRRRCVTVKMDVERMRTITHCSIVAFTASVGPNTTDLSLLISSSFGCPCVKRPTI